MKITYYKGLDLDYWFNEFTIVTNNCNDPNEALKFLRNELEKAHNFESKLDKYITSIENKLNKKKDLISCPHCYLFLSIKELEHQFNSNKPVNGTYHNMIDLGEFDGWDCEDSPIKLYKARCKYCNKIIYSSSNYISKSCAELLTSPHKSNR